MNGRRGRVRGGLAMLAFAVIGLGAGVAKAAPVLDTAGLAPGDIALTRRLLDQAQAHLPDAMRASADAVTIRWTATLAGNVHGHAGRSELLLNAALLPPLREGRDAPAMAALLHELAHFHDRTAGISRDPRFLDLAGWQVRATRATTRIAGRVRENRFVDRSPDAYELSRPSEYFAVNLEHYLLDPQYGCRRPAMARYLRERVGAASVATPACDDALVYVDAGEGQGGALASIDPARVYAIDYLLAEGNAQPMSRWGHSMLRLVVCAPGRAPGPDCRLDLSHHRVLSFRAFVDDVRISGWRGLSGRYPSRLFVLPMEQVIDEYTRVELRGLRSVPLRLRREEIAAVLERTAQVHWSYDGRYYFLGNNCAAETWKLLHDSLPRLAGQGIGSITPTGLLRRLENAGVADASVLDDAGQARRVGYRFPSQGEYYDGLYATVKASLSLPYADVGRWMALSPEQRRPWIERADLRASAALLLLEQATQRRALAKVREELKRRYLASGREEAGATDAVRRMLRESAYLGRPSRLLGGAGYGLPQADERDALQARSTQLRNDLREVRAELERGAREWMGPMRRGELDAIAVNTDRLGARLRALHAQQGGLRLP